MFTLCVWFASGDVTENSIVFSDMVKILSNKKTITAACTSEPDAQAPWIFQKINEERLKKDKWFKEYDIGESTLPIMKKLAQVPPNPNMFDMPNEFLESRWPQTPERNLCKSFQNCSREQILDDVLGFKESFGGRKIALFEDVWVDGRGLIVHRQTCKAVRNGACLPAQDKFTPLDTKEQPEEVLPMVLSLATSWRGTWHFPMEDVAALAHIDRKILDKVVFHLPAKTDYITSWLSNLGVTPERMVTGTVACQVLLIPQMRCGEPLFSQLEWMREAYLPEETAQQRAAVGFEYRAIPAGASSTVVTSSTATTNKPSATVSSSASTSDVPPTKKERMEAKANAIATAIATATSTTTASAAKEVSAKSLTLLMIERNQNRGVVNMNEVHNYATTFAREHALKLLVHSDLAFPALLDQMRNFAQADIVLAPHGAGLLFTTFLPYTSCVIEFSHPSNPYCYAHIAYVRNLSYVMMDMRDNTMNLNQAKVGLERCIHAVTMKKQELGIAIGEAKNVPETNTNTASGGSSGSSGGATTGSVVEVVTEVIKTDSVIKDVLTTLSNFVP